MPGRDGTAIFIRLNAAGLLLAAILNGCGEKPEREDASKAEHAETPASAKVSRAAGGETVVTLGGGTQKQMGLETEPLVAETRRPERTAYGRVLDPAPLFALDAELTAAEAGLAASKGEFERIRTLRDEGGVSLQSLEAAQARFRSDESRARELRRRLALGWGGPVSDLDSAAREALIERLTRATSGSEGDAAALARVDLPAGEIVDAAPEAARAVVLGREERLFPAAAVWPAPALDAAALGQGFFMRIDAAAPALRPGAPLAAFLAFPGEPEKGVRIPRPAVLRYAGKTWIYLQTGDDAFSRTEVVLGEPTEKGWFSASTIVPGTRVVTTGAQALLSEELISGARAGGEEK